MLVIWLVLTGLEYSLACNRKYVNDVVVTHFDAKATPKCQGSGQHCKYDRNCCAGLECKMEVQDFNIVSHCQHRKVYENYVEFMAGPTWKDYQEMASSEEERLNRQNLVDLERRNADLLRKLTDLRVLRKSVKHQQMMDMKKKLEEVEIEELKEEKLKHTEKFNLEVDRLKLKDLQDKVEDLEKKEVNHTLSKQDRMTDLYMNMLSDLIDKEGGFNIPAT